MESSTYYYTDLPTLFRIAHQKLLKKRSRITIERLDFASMIYDDHYRSLLAPTITVLDIVNAPVGLGLSTLVNSICGSVTVLEEGTSQERTAVLREGGSSNHCAHGSK